MTIEQQCIRLNFSPYISRRSIATIFAIVFALSEPVCASIFDVSVSFVIARTKKMISPCNGIGYNELETGTITSKETADRP